VKTFCLARLPFATLSSDPDVCTPTEASQPPEHHHHPSPPLHSYQASPLSFLRSRRLPGWLNVFVCFARARVPPTREQKEKLSDRVCAFLRCQRSCYFVVFALSLFIRSFGLSLALEFVSFLVRACFFLCVCVFLCCVCAGCLFACLFCGAFVLLVVVV
jgi:hypothetical protein